MASGKPIDAPKDWRGITKHLGPGLIVTACIVGSGELIATPKVGADHGFSLLWFIVIGCVIKVFVQVELGRAAVAHGKTTLQLMNEMPGPRLVVSWLVWCWLFMYIGVFFQLSGIVGGVGQVFAELNIISGEGSGFITPDKILAIGVSVATALILASGRYKTVERFSVYMVLVFTLTTVYALFMLQTSDAMESYRITGAQVMEGLQFRLPDDFSTAFAAFGIIGVGATELIYYPYWCLEKGYSKNVGTMDGDSSSQYDCPRCGAKKSFLGTIYTGGIAWMRKASLAPKCSDCGNILGNAELRPGSWYLRAQGWLYVMRIDAWVSMVIYTSATVAFYLLGAALLREGGLSDKGMIVDLSKMFKPLGQAGLSVFLAGAFVVLFSTLVSATASNARLLVDGMCLYKIKTVDTEEERLRLVRICCIIIPMLCAGLYMIVGAPVSMVLMGGVAQAMMLPFLAAAALYFRYRKTDQPLRPGNAWTIMLWISALAMAAVGIYQLITKITG